MRRRVLSLCVITMLNLCCSISSAADKASTEKLLNSALSTWRSGDIPTAEEQLSAIIESGSEDARAFYYRGILSEQMGKDSSADFKAAAKLEAEGSATTLVNRALEKVQGSTRAKIEQYRVAARNALKADPEAARLKVVYREALEARRQGDLTTALAKLEEATSKGTDARYFYMHGVTLAETGDVDGAKAAFKKGLSHETTAADTQLVSLALADVQGEIRRLIEEQTVVEDGDRLVTRQSNIREIQRRSLMSQDQLLAEASAASEDAAEQALAAAEARRLAAAEAIMAENKAKEELVAKINDRPTPPVAEKAADEEMAEEIAAVAEVKPVDPNAPVNPFLGGGAGSMPARGPAGPPAAPKSSVSPGPIDMSYLPAATEYLMYARPADMLSSGFVKPLTDMPQFQQSLEEMSKEVGFVPDDIDSVTMGMGNIMTTMLPLMAQMGGGAPPDGAAIAKQLMGGENSMIVIRTNKDIDIAPLMKAGNSTESTYESKAYYLLQNPDPNAPQMALHSVDAKTFLLSSEIGVQAAISNGAGESSNEQFAYLSRTSHMVQSFATPLLAAMSGSIPDAPPEAPPQVAQFLTAVKGKIAGVAIVMEAGSDLALSITLNLTDDSAASDANQALAGGLVMAKQMAPLALGQAPPKLQPSLRQTINSLTSSAAKNLVVLGVRVPGSLVQAIKDSPEMLGPIVAARNASERVQQKNNLKQVALAMFNYHDTFLHFPVSDGNGETGTAKKSGLSWRVFLLPYIEQAPLYKQFHFDEPWDSEHNKSLIPLMPETYKVKGVDTPGETTIHVFADVNTPFNPEKPTGMRDIIDGSSNTIMAVVGGPETAVPWTKPGGLPFDTNNPIAALGTLGESFLAALCDGAVREISAQIAPETLSNLIQHNDGKVVGDF